MPLKPLGRPHVPVLLRIIGSPATFTKSDSSCKVSLLNLSHVNPLVIRLGQLVSPFFLIKPSARKFKLSLNLCYLRVSMLDGFRFCEYFVLLYSNGLPIDAAGTY
ncbi:unnamed protein product [Schistocephalus solidus]|uniref:Uncharacterized protein n=1 Tax=Schistocephalus solidus TaxID=70667 RepID=A0A3P7DHA1_SCHSO|nr:unnamed protein product [Schistocephalus solidus]